VSRSIEIVDEAGATELASLIHRALKILNVADPTNRAARQEALQRPEPEDFEQLDGTYFALETTADLDGAGGRQSPEVVTLDWGDTAVVSR
jgi:hypothetical protein